MIRQTPYPPLPQAAYGIGVLFLVTLISQLDRQLPALLVAPLRTEFAISDTAFGVLHSYAFAVAFTLLCVPLGRLVDSRNRRDLIVAGLLLWSGATALFAFGRDYNALLLSRVALGAGEAVLAPAAFSLIADLVPPPQRGRALGTYGVSIAVGSGASMVLGGWLMAVIPSQGLVIPGFGHLSAWRLAFLAAALPGVPLALLLRTTVREPARQRDGGPGSRVPGTPSIADFIAHLREQPATFWRLLSYPTVLSFLGYGSLAWAPALFERSHGLPPARSGVILGIGVAAAGTGGMLVSGFLSDRWYARGVEAARLRVALVGVAIAALPAITWSLVPSSMMGFTLLFVLVIGISMAQSAVPASIQSVFPEHFRGQAIGSYLLLSGLLGIGLGPTAVALVSDHVFHDDRSLPYAVALTAGPAVLFGLCVLGTGLAPFQRTHTRLQATAASPTVHAGAGTLAPTSSGLL